MSLKTRIYRMEMVLADRCPLCGGEYRRDGHVPLSEAEIRERYARRQVKLDVTRLSDHEIDIIHDDNPAWMKALTDEQLELLCESQDDGDLAAFWASLTPEQQKMMMEEAPDLNW